MNGWGEGREDLAVRDPECRAQARWADGWQARATQAKCGPEREVSGCGEESAAQSSSTGEGQ